MAHGNFFGLGKKCVFLTEDKCSIYKTRPNICQKYQCGWSQYLIDEDLRPDKCGIIVSVRTEKNEQYFELIETKENISYETYERIENTLKKLNSKIVRVRYGHNNNS